MLDPKSASHSMNFVANQIQQAKVTHLFERLAKKINSTKLSHIKQILKTLCLDSTKMEVSHIQPVR